MAIPSDAVWEVRASGTGVADTNGSGFSVSLSSVGTSVDYSQQNSPQVTFSSGNANRLNAAQNSTTVTSDGTPFTAAMQGNAIHITSGTNFVAGWYFITTFNSSSSVVVDRAPATAGAGSAGLGNLGGASLTINNPPVVAGNTVYIQATATYTKSTTWNLTTAGSAGLPITYIGYTTIRSDNGFATLQITANSTDVVNPGNFTVFRNIIADSNSKTSSRGFVNSIASPVILVNCRAINFTTGGGFATSGGWLLENCYATGGTSAATAGFSGGSNTILIDCVSAGNACSGFSYGVTGGSTTYQSFVRCIAANNTGSTSDGFVFANTSSGHCIGVLQNCVSYSNGRDQVRFSNSSTGIAQPSIRNCILVGNGSTGVLLDSVSTDWSVGGGANNLNIDYNVFYANGSTARTQVAAGAHDVTVTADPFTNGSGGDFSLAANAAGAACSYAGFPGAYNGISTTGYLDAGAAQHPGAVMSRKFTGF